jgi:hypothetical protein
MARVINSFNLMYRFSGTLATLKKKTIEKVKFDTTETITESDIKVIVESGLQKSKFADLISIEHDKRFITNADVSHQDIIDYDGVEYIIINNIDVERADFDIYLGVKNARV